MSWYIRMHVLYNGLVSLLPTVKFVALIIAAKPSGFKIVGKGIEDRKKEQKEGQIFVWGDGPLTSPE